MKPLIKWPGGKSAEISRFETLIPAYDRYIEPFAGGAALFFHLRPASAMLNDISADLMRFYEMVRRQDPEFKRLLLLYESSFTALKARCLTMGEDIRTLFAVYGAALEMGRPVKELRLCAGLADTFAADPDICGELVPDRAVFARELELSLEDKIRRTLQLNAKAKLSDEDLSANLMTGFARASTCTSGGSSTRSPWRRGRRGPLTGPPTSSLSGSTATGPCSGTTGAGSSISPTAGSPTTGRTLRKRSAASFRRTCGR